jgi:hypothetical protein
VKYLFVGERQSPKAAQIGATWQNGRMAARTLHAALLQAGVSLETCEFTNLWTEPGLRAPSTPPLPDTLTRLAAAQQSGMRTIGMGRIVQKVLTAAGIPFVPMVHPAARGAIRRRARFEAHVREVLEVVA